MSCAGGGAEVFTPDLLGQKSPAHPCLVPKNRPEPRPRHSSGALSTALLLNAFTR